MIARLFPFALAMVFWLQSQAQRTVEVNYTVADGLPSNMVYAIEQDDRGFMWFGTDSGLSRFDGYEFINYSLKDGLPDTEILNFYKDSDQRIWFYTLNGKVGYLKNDSIYSSANTEWLSDLDFSTRITSIVEVGEFLYLSGHYAEVKVLAGKKVTSLDINQKKDQTFSLCKCNGKLRAISGLAYLSIERYEVIKSKVVNNYGGDFIYPICYDGDIYSFRREKRRNGIIRIRDGQEQLFGKDYPDRLLNLKKLDNKLVLFTESGIYKVDPNYPDRTTEYLSVSLPSSSYIDEERNFWYSSLNNGVMVRRDIPIKKIGNIYEVSALTRSQDHLYLGHQGKHISSYSQSGGKLQERFHLSSSIKIHSIDVDSTGDIWTARNDLLFRGDSILRMRRSRVTRLDGNSLLQGRKDGFVVHNVQDGTHRKIFSTPVADMIVLESDSVLLASSEGLYVYNNDTIKELRSDTLLKTRVHRIVLDESNNLWIATGGNGLLRLTKDGELIQITSSSGLSSDVCTNLTVAKADVWVVTTKGLNKISINPSSYSITTMDQSNGLNSYRINDILWHKDSIYLAQDDGLYAFSDEIELRETAEFGIFIDEVLVDGEAFEGNLFNSTISSIQVTFKALVYRNHESLKYQYQLKNSDSEMTESDWLETSNIITFSNLAPGDYTLSMRAKTKNSTWTRPYEYTFEISAAFWETATFTATVSLLSLLMIFLGTRRFYKSREAKKELSRARLSAEIKALKAQINPHFLFNGLNSIQAFILEGDLENSEEYLSKYGRLMRSVLTQSEKLTATIADEIEVIKLYADLEQIRIENKFELLISVQDSIDQKKQRIPSMIIQPFIENAIWHGITPKQEKGKIELSIAYRDEMLEIEINDNGVGFDTARVKPKGNHKSFGTKLVAERIALINVLNGTQANFHLESQINIGTSITIRFPRNLD